MSLALWLHDPERVLLGTSHAIERARARGSDALDPDDLLAGMLLAVARFGIVDFGERVIDLADLDLRFDLPVPDVSVKPRYTPAAAAVFDRAVRVARGDGQTRLAPIHLLVALGDHAVPTFSRIAVRVGVDPTGWRRLLASIAPPAASAGATAPAGGLAAAARSAPAAPPPAGPARSSEGLMTPEAAALALGIPVPALHGYVRSGRLPAFRVAGEHATRVRGDDVAALLRHLRAPSAARDPAPTGNELPPRRVVR